MEFLCSWENMALTGEEDLHNVPLDLPTHNASVDYWITYVTRQALAHGLKPFFWDTGGVLDRRNNTVIDQETIDAIIAGGN